MSDDTYSIVMQGHSGSWFVVWIDRTGAMRAIGPIGDREAQDLRHALQLCAQGNGSARGLRSSVERVALP